MAAFFHTHTCMEHLPDPESNFCPRLMKSVFTLRDIHHGHRVIIDGDDMAFDVRKVLYT